MNLYLHAIRSSFDFDGRAPRREYWFFHLFWFGVFVLAAIMDDQAQARGQSLPLGKIVFFVHLIPWLALNVRRLHDLNSSGWLLLLVPLAAPGLVLTKQFSDFIGVAEVLSFNGASAWNVLSKTVLASLFFYVGFSKSAPSPSGSPADNPRQPAASEPSTSIVTDLARLGDLRERGIITDAEFQSLKVRILPKEPEAPKEPAQPKEPEMIPLSEAWARAGFKPMGR